MGLNLGDRDCVCMYMGYIWPVSVQSHIVGYSVHLSQSVSGISLGKLYLGLETRKVCTKYSTVVRRQKYRGGTEKHTGYLQLLEPLIIAKFHAQIWQFWKSACISETTAYRAKNKLYISTLWCRKRVFVQLLELLSMPLIQQWQCWKSACISEATAHKVKDTLKWSGSTSRSSRPMGLLFLINATLRLVR